MAQLYLILYIPAILIRSNTLSKGQFLKIIITKPTMLITILLLTNPAIFAVDYIWLRTHSTSSKDLFVPISELEDSVLGADVLGGGNKWPCTVVGR